VITSVANDNKVDTSHLQDVYLNSRCAYLTEQLAQLSTTQVRRQSVSVSDECRVNQKQTPVKTRERHACSQVIIS